MRENIILYSGITLQTWGEIKRIACNFDVEEGDSPEHIFDARDDGIFIWGRDGWREGFYHAHMWFDEDAKQVRLTRSTHHNSMSLSSARKLIGPMFQSCIKGEAE